MYKSEIDDMVQCNDNISVTYHVTKEICSEAGIFSKYAQIWTCPLYVHDKWACLRLQWYGFLDYQQVDPAAVCVTKT